MSEPQQESQNTTLPSELAEQFNSWQQYLSRRGMEPGDRAELSDHLESTVADLTTMGLTSQEAFLVAIQRIGSQSDIANGFAKSHSQRIWRQLVTDSVAKSAPKISWLGVAIFAIIAAAIVQIPLNFFPENRSVPNYVLLFISGLAGYFAWRRKLNLVKILMTAVVFIGMLLVVNLYPFHENLGRSFGSDTLTTTLIFAPVLLWLTIGYAYTNGAWRSHVARLDFIKFSGEFVTYWLLLALGFAALCGIVFGVFAAFGFAKAINEVIVQVLFGGAAAATVVAAWLVESKQEAIENMAPVLSRVFLPLFGVALLAMLLATVAGGSAVREVLFIIDLILLITVALVLYQNSARDENSPAGGLDWLQLSVVILAIVLAVISTIAMLSRLTDENGFTPNRVACLGLVVVLLGNLLVTGFRLVQRIRGRESLVPLLRWQTGYLAIYGIWSLFVAVLMPLIFNFG